MLLRLSSLLQRRLVAGFTGLFVLFLTPCTAWAAAAPLRIGIMLPLTGTQEDVANSALIGAQVAAEEINSVGGFIGRPVELVVRDDQGNPDVGYKAAQALQQAGVIAIVGICNTSVGIRVAELAQAKQLPLMVSCATGSTITSKYPAAQSYIFRTSASTEIQTEFIVNDIMKGKARKIALLVDNSSLGEAALEDLTAALSKAGLKPKAVVRFDMNAKNIEKEMRELRNTGSDVLIGWTTGQLQGLIAATRAAIGWQVPQYGGWELSNASAYTASGGKVEGALMVQTVLPNRHLERNSAFLSAYARRSREHPMGSMIAAAQTYDAVHLLMRAIYAGKGDLSGPTIKASLEKAHEVYRGVLTTYDQAFTEQDHDAVSINMLWLGTWRNGERVYYYEEDEKRAAVIRHKR